MDHTVTAVNTAKKVFQLHWVEHETGSIERLQLKRARLLEWFSIREPSLVVRSAQQDRCRGCTGDLDGVPDNLNGSSRKWNAPSLVDNPNLKPRRVQTPRD
jgi:hypothetical protein